MEGSGSAAGGTWARISIQLSFLTCSRCAAVLLQKELRSYTNGTALKEARSCMKATVS